MKCIIIDDEPLALNIIRSYCEEMGGLEVIGIYTNPLESIDQIKNSDVDLVFLDIEMPQITGIDFIQTLENRPYFIFTTAYAEYATVGFDLNAIDYLVKPIPFPRFVKAINRVKEIHELRNQHNPGTENLVSAGMKVNRSDGFIFVKSEYDNVKIRLEDITYIQGLKDYLKIHLSNAKPVLTLMNFKSLEEKLPLNSFIRVHRSYLVNVNRIKTVQKSKVVLDDMRIPIGESFREDFLRRIGLG